MTSIVGVLNKRAVAIAADSAVTMGNTHKVINSANKIFTLSKYHPVAIMTYSNAAFMGVPWEIIIKEYRKQLKETSFLYLKDYINDFVKFLHNHHFFTDDQTQKEFLVVILDSFLNICQSEIYREKGIPVDKQNDNNLEEKLNQCLESNKKADKCNEFVSYAYEDFYKYSCKVIDAYLKKTKD